MKNIESRGGRVVVRLFLFAQFAFPMLNILVYQHFCGYPAWTVFCHQIIITLAYLALFGLVALPTCQHRVRASTAARYVLPLAWGSLTVSLYYSYLLAWVGRAVGMRLPPSMVLPYVLHPSWVLSALPVWPAAFWDVLVGVPLLLMAAYLAAARPLGVMFLRLRARLRHTRRTRPMAFQGGTLAVALSLLLAIASLNFFPWPIDRTPSRFFGDPILLALRADEPYVALGNFRQARIQGTADGSGQQALMPITASSAANEMAWYSYTIPGQFDRKNVILIVVDACRADHLGVLGYARDTTPFLDSLKQSGHLRIVRSFYSASCCTFGGVMSLLRSQNWFKMSHRGFALQDALKKAGYQVHFVANGDLGAFEGLRSFHGTSVDTLSDGSSSERHFGLNDDRGVLESFEKLPSSNGTPAFFYFHLMSVHPLGPRQPQYVRYWPAVLYPEPQEYGNNYDNGVVQADATIREIFAKLQAKGYLPGSLVVITGDHGESIGERGVFSHMRNLYAEEVSPPLLIYDPDPVIYRNLDFARQIDVAPTILDRLGLPIPSSWDGHSLLHDEPQRFSYLSLANYYAVIDHTSTRTLKYIYG